MTSCDFKTRKKEKKKTETACCIRNTSICSLETYYDRAFQKLFAENHSHNQWIVDLMTMPDCPGDKVFHDAPDWLLARDLHRGPDNRYLVVFRDRDLYCIHDLRAQHVTILRGLLAFLRRWLPAQEPLLHSKYHMYFHYMPSVFQLHMHVSMRKAPDSLRAQDVQHVILNLEHTDTWYRDALILCNSSGVSKARPCDPTKLE
jgi:hypothetical protein